MVEHEGHLGDLTDHDLAVDHPWTVEDAPEPEDRNLRVVVRTLAETLHISRANAYARLERLQSSGAIRGFRADVDPAAQGLGTSAYVTVNLRQEDWRDIRERLRTLPGVAHIALVGGEFDATLLVRAADNADLRRIVLDTIHGMPGVLSTRTLLLFEEPELLP